jgi:hypothetical protein
LASWAIVCWLWGRYADASLASGPPLLAIAEPALPQLTLALGTLCRAIGDANALDALGFRCCLVLGGVECGVRRDHKPSVSANRAAVSVSKAGSARLAATAATARLSAVSSIRSSASCHFAVSVIPARRTDMCSGLPVKLGIVAAPGREGIKELLKIIASEEDARLPVDAHTSLVVLAAELQAMQTLIGSIEKWIMVQHRSSEASQWLESIPEIGVIGSQVTVCRGDLYGAENPADRRYEERFLDWRLLFFSRTPRLSFHGGLRWGGPRSKSGISRDSSASLRTPR